MKKIFLPYLFIMVMSSISLPVFAQTLKDTAALGLPGDNLDLYAVLDLFLKSKTIEDFEKSLNEEKTGINNLDLNLDKKVDFIKVVTKKENDSYTFILQDILSKTDSQDVAVILVSRDKDKKVSVQMVGDEDLYGKDYVIEPKTKATPAVTANPAYEGPEPAKDAPASTTTVVVQSAPIVQYVYSPAYVPYYPPYYYGFYPPYFAMGATIAVGIYRANHYYNHYGYYGGHYGGGNTVIINNNNRNQINHYNNQRTRSNTVSNNMANGSYGNRQGGASGGNRPSTMPSNRPSGGASASTRPSNAFNGSTRQSGPSASTRPATSDFSSSNRSNSGGGGRSGGGGYSGGSRGGGGGGRGGGGGGRRR